MKTFKIFKQLIVVAFLSLICSCATEETIQPKQTIQQTDLKSRFISEDELKTILPTALDKINEFNVGAVSNTAAKISYSNKYGFSVDTDLVLLIEKGDYKSFTFPIKRSTPNGLLENLFLHPYNGGYLPFLFRYNFNSSDLNNLANGIAIPNLISKISFIPLDNFDMGDLGVKYDTTAARSGTVKHTMMINGVCSTIGSIDATEDGSVINWIPCNNLCNCDTSTPGSGGGTSSGINMGLYCALVDIRSSLSITVGGGSTGGGSGGGSGYNPFNPPLLNANPSNPQTPGLYNNGDPIFGIVQSQAFTIGRFVSTLTTTQANYWNNVNNEDTVAAIIAYLNVSHSADNQNFVKQIIDAGIQTNLTFDVSKSASSPSNIDLSEVSGNSPQEVRFNAIYNKLMASPSFKQMFISIFDNNTRYNIKFKIGSVVYPNNEGETKPLSLTSTNVYNEITLRTDFVAEASEVRIATVIIHEIIHAYLNVTRVNPSAGLSIETLSTKDFAACINSCYNGLNGPMSQHDFMTDYMGPVIAEILTEIKSSLFTTLQKNRVEHPEQYDNYYLYAPSNTVPPTMSAVVTPWIWNDFIWYQSFQGLDNCTSFNTIFEPNSIGRYYYNKYLSVANIAFAPSL